MFIIINCTLCLNHLEEVCVDLEYIECLLNLAAFILCCLLFWQVQFIAVMVHSFQLLFIDCNYPRAFMWFIGMHSVLFFFLFREFYKQTYQKKRKISVAKARIQKVCWEGCSRMTTLKLISVEMELLEWINCILKIKVPGMIVVLLTDAAWWGGHGIAIFSPYHWLVCVCVRACAISRIRHESKWPTCLCAGLIISVTYLWSGVMVRRSCRGSWTTWAVSVRMSSSPWRPREAATLPSRAQTNAGDWKAHWAMKFTVYPPTVTCA